MQHVACHSTTIAKASPQTPQPGREGSQKLKKVQQPNHCYNTKEAGTKPARKVPANHSHAESQSRTSCQTPAPIS